MGHFRSSREKKLWLWALVVLLGIYATLLIGKPMIDHMRQSGVTIIGFLAVMFLVALTVVLHGLKVKMGRTEIVVWIGIAAVYIMVLLRITVLEERSHLMEYSVLAVLIHEALLERNIHGGTVRFPALLAIGLTIIFGTIDEGIQFFLPHRVFDIQDITFNSMAAIMAMGSSKALTWARKKIRKS
ncbi:VanZ family protein [Sediminicola sp. 1XM1-17]|uniref:VanZ family protein n=1 Tax=Sediminicola sp. 1XM1-17 TaxID=3127702 RepID=UPI003078835C